MWFSNMYRRHLCDMHIEDWNDEFLSKFSPDEYYQNLKAANIQNAMLYFQSHVGYCYYPTKSGHMHQAFLGREDMMRRLARMCRENGIAVTGYYSLIYNNWAHDHHPQWRMVNQEGNSARDGGAELDLCCSDASENRYGLCCPNHPEYREFILDQITEINGYFDFDGMFFDMLFWPHLCYCEHCRERWQKETGGELPVKEDWDDPRWLLHIKKRREWMGEFAAWVTSEMKRLRPGISVEHNFATAVLPDWKPCCAEPVNAACDYAGGDLYGGILEQSFTCKFYHSITNNQPFEYMFSRCKPNLSVHTVTKSEDEMRAAVFLTCAHHGATLVIDAIDPAGTLDARVYSRIGKIFEEEKRYESYLQGVMIEDAGVYYSLCSKFSTDAGATNHQGCVNTVQTCIERHVSVGVTGGYHGISQYKALFAPCLTQEDSYDNARLIRYVKDGGTLYFSGAENAELLSVFFGGRKTGSTNCRMTYLAPKTGYETCFCGFNKEYPLPYSGKAPIVEGMADEKVYAALTLPYTEIGESRFASIHSNPPGISTDLPGIAVTQFGAGRAVWSALPIESVAYDAYREILINLVLDQGLRDQFTVFSDAPRQVELVSFQDGPRLLVSAVHLSEEESVPPIPEFHVRIKSEGKPKRVMLLPDGKDANFTFDGQIVCFPVRDLRIFNMYQIEFEKE